MALSTARISTPPDRRVVIGIAALGCLAAGGSMLMALRSQGIGADLGEPLIIASLIDWTIIAYVVGGCIAWGCRPGSRLGRLMIGAGFATWLITLSWSTGDITYTLGQACDKLPEVLFLHVFLAFPDGRVRGAFSRVVVVGAYFTAIVFELARMVVGDYGPHNLLGFAPNQGVFDVLRDIQLLALSVFCSIGAILLLARGRPGGTPVRRLMGVVIQGFAWALILIAALNQQLVWGGLTGPGVRELRWAVFFSLGLAPVVLLAGLLQIRLARTAVGDLVVRLSSQPSPDDLRDALARAVGDASLAVVYWLPQYRCWADTDGRWAQLPGPESRSVATEITRDGEPVAALIHHPALLGEPELLEAAGAAAGMALENGRLQAELRARVHELAGSRLRVLEVGQKERQRLERNLHDGAQQRLVALTLEVGMLQERLSADHDAQQRLEGFKREIALSLEELRDVARGIYPAVLTGHGLALALESLTARSTMPLQVSIDLPQRLPEPIEVAAYYVACESLANIEKHAQASLTTLTVSCAAGVAVIDIVDDGVGGADARMGSGLRGLADRVEALDGRLRVWSPPGGGTKVRAEIPCG